MPEADVSFGFMPCSIKIPPGSTSKPTTVPLPVPNLFDLASSTNLIPLAPSSMVGYHNQNFPHLGITKTKWLEKELSNQKWVYALLAFLANREVDAYIS